MPEKFDAMNPIIKRIVLMIGFAALVLGAIFLAYDAPHVRIRWVNRNGQDGLALRPNLTFSFSKPVQSDLVQELWITDPKMEGQWSWLDEQHATWIADEALQVGEQFHFGFEEGLAEENERKFVKGSSWVGTARNPSILFNQPVGDAVEIFRVDPENPSLKTQLTATGGEIYEFAGSPDGEWIAFTLSNETEGADLWVIKRNGREEQKIVDCGAAICSLPSWSPNGYQIAFFVDGARPDRGDDFDTDGIYFFDRLSGTSRQIFGASPLAGSGINWSPEGEWLSLFLGEEAGIELKHVKNSRTLSIQDASGSAGSWSADGGSFFYQRAIREGVFLRYQIMRINLENEAVEIVAGATPEMQDFHFFQPVANPLNNTIAVMVQSNLNLVGRELWLISKDGQILARISTDLTHIIHHYKWLPDGEQLIFSYLDFPPQGEGFELEMWSAASGTGPVANGVYSDADWLP